MCEFCIKHGEGKKWYLEARNYSDDMLSDLKRRKFIESFAQGVDSISEQMEGLKKLDRMPAFLRRAFTRRITRHQKREHFGQVVPIEDVRRIFEFVVSVIRVPCICRLVSLGQEKRYCYGVSLAPNGGRFAEIVGGLDSSFVTGPDSKGLEEMDKGEALALMEEYEKDGLCHTVWTFGTPFIAGICNCDRADCLALRTTLTHDVPVMFRAEYVAEVKGDSCSGCRQCMRVCQYGAMVYSASNKKTEVDQRRCYGCGICRAVCAPGSIHLQERANVPVAAKMWL